MKLLGVPPRKGGVGLYAASPRHSCLMAVGFPLQSLTQEDFEFIRSHDNVIAFSKIFFAFFFGEYLHDFATNYNSRKRAAIFSGE